MQAADFYIDSMSEPVREAFVSQVAFALQKGRYLYMRPRHHVIRPKSEEDGRRKGNLTTAEQQLMLEQAFLKKEKPTPTEYTMLAERIKLPETRVKTWFQNRRTRENRLRKQSTSTACKESEQHGLVFFVHDLRFTPVSQSHLCQDAVQETLWDRGFDLA
ncbi:putative Vax1 transcription factor [Planoprotostelium fungivorum]|uniref:Putative Vax1 transcription factor n=1 Tax=Planoprotostelium fungivorum TaxID=1890364 RepID=A0A2P6N8M9_9EUKA|nr:putative Vax1 transcription factor [Planoprotostelium fungivorum]PRP80316.1 putative Vax1 transcription factor [Planoprotostelium fungivorum]